MKLVQSFVVAALVAVPALSFAQSNQPLTRAQVRAELVELQQVGYNPASDNTQYPKNIEAAEMRLAAQSASTAAAYGGVKAGTVGAGSRSPMAQTPAQQDVVGLGSIYAQS